MHKYLALSLALVAASPAIAQDTAAVFAALDTNHDGQISQMEAQKNTVVTQNFSEADTNHDGMLSKAEFDAAFGSK